MKQGFLKKDNNPEKPYLLFLFALEDKFIFLMAGKVISTGNKDLSCLRCRKKKAK